MSDQSGSDRFYGVDLGGAGGIVMKTAACGKTSDKSLLRCARCRRRLPTCTCPATDAIRG
jgi:hypothetical protein